MSKPRLTIIVPYRDRADQLQLLVGGLASYFEQDKVDRDIPYRVLIIEQEPGLPFNRGATKNIGFILARDDCDYVCFHDVDHLPIWADYSYSDKPTPILWHGAIKRPVSMTRSSVLLVLSNEKNELFGGALLCPVQKFAEVNGHANQYWGWGMEDIDLRLRFEAAGIAWERRKGTFQPLFHDSEGHHLDGTLNAVAKANQFIFARRWPRGVVPPVAIAETNDDGLSSCRFQVLKRHPIPNPSAPERGAIFERITVRLDMRPSPEQRAAVKSL